MTNVEKELKREQMIAETKRLLTEGRSAKEIARIFGVKMIDIYRLVAENKECFAKN